MVLPSFTVQDDIPSVSPNGTKIADFVGVKQKLKKRLTLTEKHEEKENKVPDKNRRQPTKERKATKKKLPAKSNKPRATGTKKVPVAKLKPLVNSTTKMLEQFVGTYKETRDGRGSTHGNGMCNPENLHEVLKNQTILCSLINELDEIQTQRRLDEAKCLL